MILGRTRSSWHGFPRLAQSIYLVLVLFAGIIFVENFMFASGSGLLLFRDVDDLSFQTTLMQMREHLRHAQFGQLFSTNDYGYGNSYWVPLAILSTPLAWIRSTFGVEWPLIVFPREVSLFFTIATAFVLRKLALALGANESRAAISVLIYALFPFTGYFAMRFGTVSEVNFLAITAVYFAVLYWRNIANTWFISVVFCAAAISVKVTAALILPIVATILISAFFKAPARDAATKSVISILTFGTLLAFLINPVIVLTAGRPSYVQKFIETMRLFIATPQSGESIVYNAETAITTIFGTILFAAVAVVLFAGLVIASIRITGLRAFYVVCAATILVAAIALLTVVKVSWGPSFYFSILLPFLTLGLLGFDVFRIRIAVFWSIVGILVSLLVIDGSIRIQSQLSGHQYVDSYNGFSYFSKRIAENWRLRDSKQLEDLVGPIALANGTGVISVDFDAPLSMNYFHNPGVCFTYVFWNLSDRALNCGVAPDVLVLSQAADRVGQSKDSDLRRQIAVDGLFAGKRYNEVGHVGDYFVYKLAS